MDSPSPLSRAVSELDLNAALATVQTLQRTGLRYTPETLMSLRTKTGTYDEHSEVAVTEQVADGVKTPPDHLCPNPPPPTPATPEIALESGEGLKVTDEDPNVSLTPAATDAPKKKKKSGKGKGKKPPANGFEEFYADPPVTPDEFVEECDLYDVSRPFHERIENCLQRYRARRKLDEYKANVLTKYFMLGGVDSTKKAFTGGELDPETLENCTAKEIEALKAQDYIRPSWGVKNPKFYDGSSDWVVDFEGVAKGFFSYRVPRYFSTQTKDQIKFYTAIIRNFLNYVLHHGVCKEYTDDVMAARRVCDQAESELIALHRVRQNIPGDFNIAASCLHGGRFKGLSGDNSWSKDPSEPNNPAIYGFKEAEAERIFKTAIAYAGTDELFTKAMEGDIYIVSTESRFVEVAKIEFPDEKVIQEYSNVKNSEGEVGYIKPLGVVKFKAWEGPGTETEDLTDDEDESVEKGKRKAGEDEILQSFWLEHEILKSLIVGVKMDILIYTLNIGISYFDTLALYCSFYTKLPNELMVDWKEPVTNTRPPPTEDDPEIEERTMAANVEDDAEGLDDKA